MEFVGLEREFHLTRNGNGLVWEHAAWRACSSMTQLFLPVLVRTEVWGGGYFPTSCCTYRKKKRLTCAKSSDDDDAPGSSSFDESFDEAISFAGCEVERGCVGYWCAPVALKRDADHCLMTHKSGHFLFSRKSLTATRISCGNVEVPFQIRTFTFLGWIIKPYFHVFRTSANLGKVQTTGE